MVCLFIFFCSVNIFTMSRAKTQNRMNESNEAKAVTTANQKGLYLKTRVAHDVQT